jgi:hypothetical protein
MVRTKAKEAMSLGELQYQEHRSKWVFTHAKLLGWLVGVSMAFFGGVMYASPGLAYLGVPHVAVGLGLSISLSYSVAMSASTLNWKGVLVLAAAALALVVLGRHDAPVAEVMEAIETNREMARRPGIRATFGIPWMLLGVQVFQLVTPWLRTIEPMNGLRSLVSMILLEGAGFALLAAALLTRKVPAIAAQPYLVAIAIPIAVAIGACLRVRGRDWDWLTLGILAGLAWPACWLALLNL